jgi:hypothetical protein
MAIAPPPELTPETIQPWSPGTGTKLKRFIRHLGRERTFRLASELIEALEPIGAEQTWVEQAKANVAQCKDTPNLRASYDTQHSEGTIHYPTRRYMEAADLVCSILVADNFSMAYRWFLWILYLACCPLFSSGIPEVDFFNKVSRYQAKFAIDVGS